MQIKSTMFILIILVALCDGMTTKTWFQGTKLAKPAKPTF